MSASIIFDKSGWEPYAGKRGAKAPQTPEIGEYVVYLSCNDGYSFDGNGASVTSNGEAVTCTSSDERGRLKVSFTIDGDKTYRVSAGTSKQSGSYLSFFACSDIHCSGSPTVARTNFMARLDEYKSAIVCCAGDLPHSYNLTADNEVYSLFKNFKNNGTCTGNHDAGNGTANITEEQWKNATGQEGWLDVKEIFGIVFMFLSIQMSGGFYTAIKDEYRDKSFPIFDPEIVAETMELLDEYEAIGKRVILFTHYACENVSNPYGNVGNGYILNSSDPFGARIGYSNKTSLNALQSSTRGYMMPYYTQNEAIVEDKRQDTYGFLNLIAAHKNVLYFSGHAHTRWEYQYGGYDDGKNYDANGNPVAYSHIKAMRQGEDGAAMINLPSIGWAGEDAVVRVSDSRVAITGRLNGEALDNIHYFWDKASDGTFSFTFEDIAPEPKVYSISVAATGCTVSGASTITEGKTATLTITAADGYSLPEAVTVTGASYSWDKATGVLTLSDPIGAVSVTVTAVKEAEPEPIPLFDRFGNRLSLQQLWIWKDGAITHPTILYDAASNVIEIGHKHYGARWDKVNAQMTRLYDAESFPIDINNFAHRGSVNANYSNPFDSIYPWAGIKLCNISIDLYRNLAAGDSITKCVTAWEGDVDFSYNDVNGVWRYRPEFWGKSWEDDTYRYFDVSEKAIGSYVHYPEAIVGRWHGRKENRTIGGEEKSCLIPSIGMPAKSIPMSTLHTYAKNYGATLDSIYSIDADTLLCIVEFATMNTQNAIGNGVSDLYRQSSDLIQEDATDSTTVKVLAATGSAICVPDAIFDIGTSNGGIQVGSFTVISTTPNADDAQYLDVTLDRAVTVTSANHWSVHGLVNVADEAIGSKSGYIGENGKCNAYYRGIVMFGNMWLYVLGVYENKNDHHIWIANSDEEANNHDALDTTVHYDTGLVLPMAGGYIKKLGLLSRSGLLSIPAFCIETGGDSSKPVGDYFYNWAYTDNTVFLRGGRVGDGLAVGAFYGKWNVTASNSDRNIAARPCLKNP